ncbi:hypothetical protein SynSYN20_03249 [Synechococcus sp. SYN20]|nr:hypothetical protein SynSYN20_03249 [Synechococcus sp. SYN20]
MIPPEIGDQITDSVIDQGARPTEQLFLCFLRRHRPAPTKTAKP